MNFPEIKNLEEKYYANVFNRLPVAITRGNGMYLWDVSGKKYLDCFAGIAVSSLGHAHPAIVKTISEQAKELIHVSNWLYTIPQLELAELLCKISGMNKAFFTNDGTEAVECALKLAHRMTGKTKFISTRGAFHGRTLGSLGLTHSEKCRKPFEKILKYKNVEFIDYNDCDALRNAIKDDKKNNNKIAAVILEPIQGEAGVVIPGENYLPEVREITKENDILLIADEVQTGFGRTGKMFAYEHRGVKPDILCLAKGIGGGFPIGACLFREGLDFEKGEHGGTFIGSPLACAVSKAVIETIIKDKLIVNSEKQGRYLLENLLDAGFDARGKGLMIGINTNDGKKKVMELIEKGILTIHSENTVRVIPPLVIGKEHCDEFLGKI